MQLHVVAGRGGNGVQQYAQFNRNQATSTRQYAGWCPQENPAKCIERGVPEGAASAPKGDCLAIMSPPGGSTGSVQSVCGTGNGSIAQNCIQTSTSATSTDSNTGAVFYAMNV